MDRVIFVLYAFVAMAVGIRDPMTGALIGGALLVKWGGGGRHV